MKRVNILDGALGLMAGFLALHILGFTWGVSVPWWLEPDIASVIPSKTSPGETIRIRGRNFDPTTKIRIGTEVLGIDTFFTSSVVEVKLPLGFPLGSYTISARNKWNKQGAWEGTLTVRLPYVPERHEKGPSSPLPITESPPHPELPVPERHEKGPSSPLPITESPPPPELPSNQVDLRPPLFPEVREKSGLTSTPIPRGMNKVSLLCLLRLEDSVIKPELTFRGFLRRLPREVRVLATFPERKSFLAEVTFFTAKKIANPEEIVYYVGPSQEIHKGSPFVLISAQEYKLYAIALEDPVPRGQDHG